MKTLIVPIAALMLFPSWARADGYESYKDTASGSYSRAYTAQPVSWRCPPEFSRHECRRIRAEAELRRARRTRQIAVYTPRALRNVDPGPERITRAGRRCASFLSVKGDARPSEFFARGSALKEWRKRIRTTGPGEAYIDERYSPDFRIGKCQIVGDRGILKRCTASGTPCQP
jgi:hypothetical protein